MFGFLATFLKIDYSNLRLILIMCEKRGRVTDRGFVGFVENLFNFSESEYM
jgi:hypothetical protein